MKIKQLLDRRAGYSLASLGLLLSLAAPAVIPAFASAETLALRSITMSTSAVDATDVSYKLQFNGTTGIDATESTEGGIIIDFCSNTAVLGDECTAPTGLDVSSASVIAGSVEYADAAAEDGSVSSATVNRIVWTAGETYAGAGAKFEIEFEDIKNPSDVGIFYARVTTYEDAADLATNSAADDQTVTYGDEGSIALAATAGIGVTSYVLESMSFCVSLGDVGDDSDTGNGSLHAITENVAPSENCGSNESDCDLDEVGSPDVQPGCVIAPSMTLGKDDGSGNVALGSGFMALGEIWAQISSNASGDTVVNLKSDAKDCGGLYRNGTSDAAHCNIAPADGDFSAGTPKFGLKLGSAEGALKANGDATTGGGTIAAVDGSGYNASTFLLNFASGNGTGVTSTYGDPLFKTTGAVDNMNIPITFGASISNNTPAGTYGATLSMIAVGTF